MNWVEKVSSEVKPKISNQDFQVFQKVDFSLRYWYCIFQILKSHKIKIFKFLINYNHKNSAFKGKVFLRHGLTMFFGVADSKLS